VGSNRKITVKGENQKRIGAKGGGAINGGRESRKRRGLCEAPSDCNKGRGAIGRREDSLGRTPS